MEQKVQRIEYRFGKAGSLAPLVAAAVMIMWAAISQLWVADMCWRFLRRC